MVPHMKDQMLFWKENCEMLKSIARDQSITPSKTQRTLPTTQKKDIPAISFRSQP